MARTHLIGLLLGLEEDWSTAFEELVRRASLSIKHGGETHEFTTERVSIEPFDLRMTPRYAIVIDRLAYWYFQPREWLKKVALMNDVYLLNNPFTFQAMEKHAAYCAMMRLGLKVPETWLIPPKQGPDNPRFLGTAAKYATPFRLEEIAHHIGYPLYMKPYDGGAWVGVTRITNDDELHQAYDESGQRLMHLQSSVEGYDVFARALSIGAETMVMRFDPDRPHHDRYQVQHGFLPETAGWETVTIGRLINAFFRWEFNSCEVLVRGDDVYPIDYANANPDIALTSLHYYFPWAIKALLKWSVFCTVTGRQMKVDITPRSWFEVGDRENLTYEDKLTDYRKLAEEYFQAGAYVEFCDEYLGHIDDVMLEYVESPDFDQLIVDTVASTFPAHEHEQFVWHYRGMLAAWAADERAQRAPSTPVP